MFQTKIGNLWDLVFTVLVYTQLWLVLLIFWPKVLGGILLSYIISLFFVKWWV